MNEVIYQAYNPTKKYIFSDATRTLGEGASAAMYFSPLNDELRAHEYKIPVIYTPRLYSVDAQSFQAQAQRGREVVLYQNGQAVNAFYLTAITGGQKLQNGQYLFNLEGTDFAGLCAGVEHVGGVYNSVPIGTILLNAIGNSWFPPETDNDLGIILYYSSIGISRFALSEDVAQKTVDGWLPYTEDFRENLRSLMQYADARLVLLNRQGELLPLITSSRDGTPITVPDTSIYLGDSYTDSETVTDVNVNEYSWYQGGEDAEELYDASGSSVDHYKVIFDAPYYDLTFTGGTINSSGANFAVITGQAVLTGRPYSKSVRRLTDSTGLTGSPVTKTVDNPIIDALNSTALLQRAKNYFANAKPLKNSMKETWGAAAGDFLRFNDPLGELVQGYAKQTVLNFSGITKANQEMVIGWSPISGDVYTEMKVIDADDTLVPPVGCTRMRLYLIQGGKGGWGGYDGQAAYSSGFGQSPMNNGAGGAVGEGGDGGKVFITEIASADFAVSYSVTIGAAGTGGGISHGEGTVGGHSIVTDGNDTFTSANGYTPEGGIRNPLDSSKVYATSGSAGIYAGKAGGGQPLTDDLTGVSGTTTWTKGNNSSAGYGGGAAYGSNGGNAGRADGSGGDGADAVLDGFNDYTAPIGNYGCGGIGGNGGGGGGGHVNSAGSGGKGSAGGDGAQGAVIVLFAYGTTPTPVPTPNYLFDSNSEQLYDYDFEKLLAKE